MLRSREHIHPAYVRFENKTGRTIDVIWIDYAGKLVKYGTLRPGNFLDVDTFKTHPWLFIDQKTGEKMKVGSNRIFYPLTCMEINERLGLNMEGNFRMPIPIILPLYTLRQISLQVIFNCLYNISGVDDLDLPLNLKNELHKLNQNKDNIYCELINNNSERHEND